jgi:hypothetical protein
VGESGCGWGPQGRTTTTTTTTTTTAGDPSSRIYSYTGASGENATVTWHIFLSSRERHSRGFCTRSGCGTHTTSVA